MDQSFNIAVRRFALRGIHHLDVAHLGLFPGVTLAFVAVKHQHQTALSVARKTAESVDKGPSGCIQVPLGQLRQVLPGEAVSLLSGRRSL